MNLEYDLQVTKQKLSLFFSVGDLAEAQDLIKQMLKKYRGKPEFHNLMGLVYHKQSQFSEAISEFKKAAEKSGDDPQAELGLAMTLCDIGEYDKASKLMAQLTQQSSEQGLSSQAVQRLIKSHLETCLLYQQCNLLDKALSELNKALELKPDDFHLNITLAKVLYKMEQPDNAKDVLESLMANHDEPKGYVWLGIVYHRLGDHHLAKQAWLKANKLDPKDSLTQAYKDTGDKQ